MSDAEESLDRIRKIIREYDDLESDMDMDSAVTMIRSIVKLSCDNTDCESDGSHEVKEVRMTEPFDEGITVDWCEDCIERDNDMVAEVFG